MFKRLRALLGRSEPTPVPVPFDAPLTPETGFFAIGDIHGHLRALEALEQRMAAIDDGVPRVFVGDYIDRGDDSAGVLRHLCAQNQADPDRTICLKGNHEARLLEFLDDPETSGQSWLQHGGLQTLASFRVGRHAKDAMADLRDRMVEAMGDDLIDWLRARPTSWVSGNVAVTHAAMNPGLPIQLQSDQTMMWGHEDFYRMPRTDGVWVVHGHVIVDEAKAEQGRIAVDTGAYATGRLTAAHVTPGDLRFVASTD